MKTHKFSWISYYLVCLGALFYAYEYFLRVIPSVIKPNLMAYFHLDATGFGTLSAFYFYAYTPLQLIVGIVVDHYRPRYVLILAIICCTLGSLMITLGPNVALASAGRFLQGLGSAFAFVGTIKLVTLYMPAERFAQYSGLAQCLGFVGAGCGLMIIQHLTAALGWQPMIRIMAIIGAVLTLCFIFTLGKKYSPPFQKQDKPNISYRTNLYYLWSIVRVPQIWLSGVIAYLTFLPTSVFAALWGIPYLQKLHHYTIGQATLAISMIFFGWALGTPAMGALSDAFKTRVLPIRYGCFVALFLSLPLLYISQLPYFWVCALFFLFGFFSACEMLTFVIARDCSPSHLSTGTAIAFINTLAMLGGFLFQRGLGEILDGAYDHSTLHPIMHGIRVYSLGNYQCAVTIVPIACAAALILSFFLKESYGQYRNH